MSIGKSSSRSSSIKMFTRRRWLTRYCVSLGLDGLLDRERCEERIEGGGILRKSAKLGVFSCIAMSRILYWGNS